MRLFIGGLALILLGGLNTRAQEKITFQDSKKECHSTSTRVCGVIKDDENKPLSRITVCLISFPDKGSVLISRTDESGAYHFDNIPVGEYLVQAQLIGRQKKCSEPFHVDDQKENQVSPIVMLSQGPKPQTPGPLKSL